MRLTLRTLLAYLDGVLNEQDHADLQAQIESSDLATELVHRSRDVTGRLKLGAPSPLGSSAVDDPNTVAEYLDNTLPMESVPEFERVCLESDMMLAEAASCHQVLKLVLEKPIEIDPEVRRRLSRLRDEARQIEQAEAESPPAAPAQPKRAKKAAAPAKPEAPDYLKDDAGGGALRWAPAAAACLLLVLMSFLAFRPGGWLRGEPVAQAEAAAETPDAPAAADAQEDAEGKEADESETDSPQEEAATETAPADSDAASVDTDALPADLVGESPVVDEQPSDAGEPVVEPAAETDEPLGDPANAVESEPAPPGEAPIAAEEAAAEAPPERGGLFVGPENTLLLVEAGEDSWLRLPLGQEFLPASRLMSLPTYRPRLDLGDGLSLELVGLTDVYLERGDEGEARLALAHGRLIATLSPDANDTTIELIIGGATSRLTLEPGMSFAVASDHPHSPGHDVLSAPAPLVATAYAPGGHVVWESGRNQLTIGEPSQWSLAGGGALSGIEPYTGDPGWIAPQPLPAWDNLASPVVPSRVLTDSEVWPQLLEVVESEAYKEVRSLAARCGLAVGHPDPLVASFADESQRTLWRANLGQLRGAASRTPEQAEQIHRAFEEKYGAEQAIGLLVLLRGFNEDQVGQTPEQIQLGALPQVLESLESDVLAVRVLGSLNLDELTGRQQAFDPLASVVKRRSTLRRLRKDLQDGDLRNGAR